MKIRGLLVAVIILAALTGTLYWSNHHKPTETAVAASDVSPKILALQQADIDSIAIKKKDADQIVLKKDGNDWRITAPQSFAADQSVVTGMVAALANLDSQRLVQDHASDLNLYGLSDPFLAVSVTEKNNKSQQVLLGDATPTGNGVYAKLEADPRVFTLASFNKTSLDKDLNDLRDKRLITADADKIGRIEFTNQQETIEFGRDKDKDKDDKNQWQILKPEPMRADGSQIDSLVRAITDARMDLSSGDDPKKNASAFASGAPVVSVKLTTDAGSQELQLRKIKEKGKDKSKNEDNYYAKTSVADGVYKVPSSLGQQLDEKLEDFRNKKLFDFGFAEPNKIELHDGAKTFFFTHSGSGDDWWSGEGKKLDADSVEQLVGKLRDLQASKFADANPGAGSPVVEITITSNGGKRVEQVRISKAAHDQDYIAQRQNEATLYQLDQSVVADLQNLAASVKPAATPKK